MDAQVNLSTGNINRQLLQYALPILATSLLQSLYSAADVAIVGWFLGPAGVSAVGNASQVTHMVTLTAVGLSHGGNILVGQIFSGGDRPTLVRTASSFSLLFLFLGIVLTPLGVCLSGPIVTMLDAPQPLLTQQYLSLCCVGFAFVLSYNASAAALRALGNSRFPLLCVLIAAVVNLSLDILLVGPFGMGVTGAALATVSAQGLSACAAIFYLAFRCRVLSFTRAGMAGCGRIAVSILRLGIPGVISMLMVSLSWLVVTWLINGYGTEASAAVGIAAKIRDLFHLMISSLGIGTLSFIAQNLGARQYDRAYQVMKSARRLSLLLAAVTVALAWTAGPVLTLAFTQDPVVYAIAVRDLRIEIFSEVFYAVILTYQSMMNGAGHTMTAAMNSLTSGILCRIPLSIALGHIWGLEGVFLACAVAPAVAIPVGALYIHSGRWRVCLAKPVSGK